MWPRLSLPAFLLVLAVTAGMASPRDAGAQQPAKLPVVGMLSPFIDADSTFLRDVRQALGNRGLRDGREIAIAYRSAEGRIERLPVLADELVRLKVDIIVTASAPATRFAQQATRTIPIVMARVGDAVDQGFIATLARPGGNITGTSWFAPELSAKRLALLKETLPAIVRVGVLREAAAGAASVTAVQVTALKLGVVASIFEVRDPEEFPTALSAMADGRVEAAEVLEGPMISNGVRALVALAETHRLPMIFPDISFVEAGALMSYGPDLAEIDERIAETIEKILKGARPGNIPVEQPTKFTFAVNLKAAKALGLAVPLSIITRASVVID